RPGTPGASAQSRADKLRHAELRFQRRRVRAWLLPSVALAFVTAKAADMILPDLLAPVAGALVLYSVIKRMLEPGADVQRWRAGAEGERRTAKRLQPLVRRGWIVLHDRAVPGANLDHLVLTPDGLGALYIDTKTT